MTKTRLLTAIILIPLVVAVVFFLPPLTFFSLAMLVILLAGWEWATLAEIHHIAKKIVFLVLLAAALLLSMWVPMYGVIFTGVLWWLIALVLLAMFPKGSHWWGNSLTRSIMGFLVLIPCWLGLVVLQGFSPIILMYCLILIWSVDSAAYFVGKKWGKHKIAPQISPGKTYEGFLGGLVAASIIAVAGFFVLNIPKEDWLLFYAICLFGGGVITVLGDLFESMLKRQSQVKDSGGLLPGHGGILDRIDSMTTAIPFLALILPYFFNSY